MLGSQEFKSNMRFVSAKLKLPFSVEERRRRGKGLGGEREGGGGVQMCSWLVSHGSLSPHFR